MILSTLFLEKSLKEKKKNLLFKEIILGYNKLVKVNYCFSVLEKN